MSSFEAKELVYAFHGPMLYKARIMNIREDTERPYKIHYHGWNKKFDDWLPENKIMKINDENKELAEKLQSKFKDTKPKTVIRKRKGSKTSGDKFVPNINATLFFGIPESLKEMLIEDGEQIVIDHGLLVYTTSVDEIIAEYKKTIKEDTYFYLNEFLDGLVTYFNQAVPNQLLYLFERPQLLSLAEDEDPFVPSQIYGLQHFLRLFTILPSLLPMTSLNDALKEEFQQFTEELLQFLSTRLHYAGEYARPTDEYMVSFEKNEINI